MSYGDKKLAGGHAASHPAAALLPITVAPATGNEKNVLRESLLTVACWRLNDLRFDFDSAFVMPEAKPEFVELRNVCDAHPGSPLSIFGHADPVGDDDYNKALSGRRAEAIYAVLIHDAPRWEKLYGSDNWSLKHVQIMLRAVGNEPGNVNGTATQQSTQAIKSFQSSNGLNDDGAAGPLTRAKLFEKYFQFLFPKKLAKTDFLGKGNDAGGKMDYQGCSEFNPAMVFSQSEDAAFNSSSNKSKRNEENSVNRRVMILFFRPGTPPLTEKWVCPRATEGTAGCRKRFWKDGDVRRKPQADRREFATTQDTFACRFYHRLTEDSPCEVPGPPTVELKYKVKGKLFWNRTWDYNDETVPIPAIKEFLPGARVELFIKQQGGALASHAQTFLTDDGEFEFTAVPKAVEAEIKISLEYKDNKIVLVRGVSNVKSEPKFEIKTGKIVWAQIPLDAAPLTGSVADVDLGEVEIKTALFINLCDAYKSVWFGHKRILEMAGEDLRICPIEYPEKTISNANGDRISLLELDLLDRDVILHEYGHFITDVMLGGLNHHGYGYNDDAAGQHSPNSKEHYESAWIEGHATFLSCAIMDDPHYHDGYDSGLSMHLDTDNTQIGPHNEASIQEALWRIHKVHGVDFKTGFWKALTDTSKRKANTVFDFFDNWKDLGCPDIDKVIESYKKFNIEFGYKYRDGAGRFTRVAPPETIDVPKQEFQTITELFNEFGKTGAGTEPDYGEELYNRNVILNAGAMAAGSTHKTPKVKTGAKYIVPERFQIKK